MTKNRNLAAMLPDGNAMMVPVGNTAQRPANTAGMIRYNTTLNTLEAANGMMWANVGSGSATSSGGGGGAVQGIFYESDNTITANFTATPGKNYLAVAPIVHTSGIVTIANSIWKIV
jgi:hypothetical protein